MPLGIDFSGGTLVVVQFAQPVTEEQVRDAVAPLPGDEVVQQYGAATERRMLIRLPQVKAAEEGNSLEQGSAQVEAGAAEGRSAEVRDRQPRARRRGDRRATCSCGASTRRLRRCWRSRSISAFRFRFSFAVGAIAATLHECS